MAGRQYTLNSKLQKTYKIMFSILAIILLIVFVIKINQRAMDGIIITGIWLIIAGVICFNIVRTVSLSFDDDTVYIVHGLFKKKRSQYKFSQVFSIKTSMTGYFTFVQLYDELGRKKSFSCFNTFTSALKNNRTDLLRLNKSMIENSRPEDDTVSIFKLKVRDARK